MAYLVTGGAGFIGSHITEELIKRGDEVIVLDNMYSGRAENIAVNPKAVFIDGSIQDKEILGSICTKYNIPFSSCRQCAEVYRKSGIGA